MKLKTFVWIFCGISLLALFNIFAPTFHPAIDAFYCNDVMRMIHVLAFPIFVVSFVVTLILSAIMIARSMKIVARTFFLIGMGLILLGVIYCALSLIPPSLMLWQAAYDTMVYTVYLLVTCVCIAVSMILKTVQVIQDRR